MKLSVSLADEDVEFLDAFAEKSGVPSRSAVLQRAVALLRQSQLTESYAEAFTQWDASPDAQLWESAADADWES
ncbi:MAG: ribbon-helix-helix domain-containing protein [Actinomycetia bacterium]|nr:ribbon-helix-helix domain-containing protein [Actinomycetes bacterium]